MIGRPEYVLTWNDIDSGAVADARRTVAGLLVPDTAGAQIALYAFAVGIPEDAPIDLPFNFSLDMIKDISAGSAGTRTSITVADITKLDGDANFPDSPASGEYTFTVEPSTYVGASAGRRLYDIDVNGRGSLGIVHLPAPIIARRDQFIGALVAPRTAAAILTSGALYFGRI